MATSVEVGQSPEFRIILGYISNSSRREVDQESLEFRVILSYIDVSENLLQKNKQFESSQIINCFRRPLATLIVLTGLFIYIYLHRHT